MMIDKFSGNIIKEQFIRRGSAGLRPKMGRRGTTLCLVGRDEIITSTERGFLLQRMLSNHESVPFNSIPSDGVAVCLGLQCLISGWN